MTATPKPSYCTSIHCGDFWTDHCRDCSHSVYLGKKKIDGVKYHWEFSFFFGFMEGNIDWENKTLSAYLDKWLKRIGRK